MFATLAFALLSFAAAQRSIVETAQNTPTLSTLVTVLTLPAYAPVLQALSGPGPFTVFAPNNNAFADAKLDPSQVAFVTAVLQYHVLGARILSTNLVQGNNIASTLMRNKDYVNLGPNLPAAVNLIRNGNNVQISWSVPAGTFVANVVLANVICTNGVVHVIDKVLLLPAEVPATATAGGLTTLLEAVTKAGLGNAVTTTPGITIFAPTNQAFAAVNWQSLTPAQLTAVLTFHVVPAIAYSTSLINGMQVPTLNGKRLQINIAGGAVSISDPSNNRRLATVALADVLAKNGVVHVIDAVMLPPTFKA